MSRKAAKPEHAAHPLPQSGGSFIVTGGALVPQNPDPKAPDQSPDSAGGNTAVKPDSKEA